MIGLLKQNSLLFVVRSFENQFLKFIVLKKNHWSFLYLYFIICSGSFVSLTDNVATLFRGTSAATSLMDQYMKMVAVPYVQMTLRDTVVRIMECKHSCEVRISTSASVLRPACFH